MIITSVHLSVCPCVQKSTGSGISVDRDVIKCKFLFLLKFIILHNLIDMGAKMMGFKFFKL